MRTTLILNDDVLIEAKRRAAQRGSNVSAVVNEALIAAFRSTDQPAANPSFQMLCYHPEKGVPVQTSPAEMHDLLAAEDLKPYRE